MTRTGAKFTRRAFLAGAIGGIPLLLPSGVLARAGRPGANSRVGVAFVGTGQRGRALLERRKARVLALCDADERELKEAAAIAGPGVSLHRDYREVLERRDVDAVIVASPDHWHALHAIHAMEAGKDVYLESPVCASVAEADDLLRAARRFGCIVQCGLDGLLTRAVRSARAELSGNAWASLTELHCWGAPNRNGGGRPAESAAPPPDLDWPRWLGPARPRPWQPELLRGGFRWNMELGGGRIRSQGARVFAIALSCAGREGLGRVRVHSTAAPASFEGVWDCPRGMEVTFTLENPALTIRWTQNADAADDENYAGVVFNASGNTLTVHCCDEASTTEQAVLDAHPETTGEDAIEHWLRCVERRTPPEPNLRIGCDAAKLALLGNLSYRLQRPLTWDESAARFENDAAANRHIVEPARGPWRLQP